MSLSPVIRNGARRATSSVSSFGSILRSQENREGISQRSVRSDPAGNTVAIELDDEEAIWACTRPRIGVISGLREKKVMVEVSTSDLKLSSSSGRYTKQLWTTMMLPITTTSWTRRSDSVRDDLVGNHEIHTAYLGDVAIASYNALRGYMNYHLSGQLYEYRRHPAPACCCMKPQSGGARGV